ncbi:MAG: hypothetical protein H0T57_10125 [Rubrobacter sp.]|nr:hypothetical protein [Rubrobacter sp.]MDQ3636748.1 hypothetical protein [Actinomycetota bacterium]
MAGAAWRVYENFEIAHDEALGDTVVYAPPRFPVLPKEDEVFGVGNGPRDENLKRPFAPLRETKTLFLDFAGLVHKAPLSREKALEAMLEWITTYGVLGVEGVICPDEVPREVANNRERRESLRGFWMAVTEAARCLDLYEASYEPDDKRAASVLERHLVSGGTLRVKREAARITVADTVSRYLGEDCYPKVYRAAKSISHAIHGFEGQKTERFGLGWGFRSLLGAMYLQMWFYMERGGGGKPCKGPGCYILIGFETAGDPGPTSGSTRQRKPPSNKVFCHSACRQRWHDTHGGGKKARARQERERRKNLDAT